MWRTQSRMTDAERHAGSWLDSSTQFQNAVTSTTYRAAFQYIITTQDQPTAHGWRHSISKKTSLSLGHCRTARERSQRCQLRRHLPRS